MADGPLAVPAATVTPPQLPQLSPAELIEIILGQHALILQLPAPGAPLQARIKHLTGLDKSMEGAGEP